MSTAQWLSVLFTVVSLAVGYGVLRQTVASLRTELARVQATLEKITSDNRLSFERQGERIGKLETAAEVQKAVSDLSRGHDTRGVPR
jgi:hypothetical protein